MTTTLRTTGSAVGAAIRAVVAALFACLAAAAAPAALAQANSIESVSSVQQGSTTYLRIGMKNPQIGRASCRERV